MDASSTYETEDCLGCCRPFRMLTQMMSDELSDELKLYGASKRRKILPLEYS